jgi:hypothetical protein
MIGRKTKGGRVMMSIPLMGATGAALGVGDGLGLSVGDGEAEGDGDGESDGVGEAGGVGVGGPSRVKSACGLGGALA